MKTFRKATFAFLAAVFLFAASGIAENCLLGPCKKADLPTCGSKLKGKEFSVTNCVTAISCATTASPGFANVMVCDYTGSAWAYRVANATAAAVDLTTYAELASATSTAFTPGTDFTVTPVAGGFALNAVGAGKDGSLIVVDDLIATGTDFLPTFSATAVVTAPVTNIVASTSSTITTPTLAVAVTTVAFDAGGGTDELGIAADSVSIGAGIAFRIVGGTAPPVACAAGVKGTEYFDTDINKKCICNGTSYVLANDDTTTTGCS